ncbi:hypothetical protein NMY22_g6940 [Coprinellus aureogranulatus]|nr:hypothetical protein NMY22_g6940 [Coprinellus aureogranulatus]
MANIAEDDQNELLLSCRYGDLEDIQAFVDRHGASSLASIRDPNQNTVLHMNSAGSTPLHWAAVNQHLDIAKALVEFPGSPGANLIDIRNEAGHSPLAEAEYAGWDEGAKYFVSVMNLDTTKGADNESEGDAVLEEGQGIEVQIEDSEGQIAKMTIGGSELASKPASSPPAA